MPIAQTLSLIILLGLLVF
jgi:hypothetical protein